MFRIIATAMIAVGFAFAADQAVVPKGAKEVEPGVWKYTDRAGKVSTYRKTPFGIVKAADDKDASSQETAPSNAAPHPMRPSSGASASAATGGSEASSPQQGSTPFGKAGQATTAQNIKVVRERADSIEFERPTPFGNVKWTKSKSEVNPEEQAAWDRSRKQPAANGGQKSAGPKE